MSEFTNAIEFAEMYIEADRPRDALAALAPHLAVHPDDAVALSLAASAHLNLDEPEQARSAAERAVSVAPNTSLPWRVLALSMLALGHGHAAVEAANRAISLDSQDWAGYFIRALVDTQLRQITKETRDIATRAVALNPHHAPVHVALGDIEMAMGNRAQAQESYTAAVRLDPNNELARNNLGVLAMRRRKVGVAASAFIDVVSADPMSTLGLFNARVTVTQTTLAIHRIVWVSWGVANFAFLPSISGGVMGDPVYGVPLRWSLAAFATIALVIFVARLRTALGSNFDKFLRTVTSFSPNLRAWLVWVGIAYLAVVIAALVGAPWFRVAYFCALTGLVAGSLLSHRIKKNLNDERIRLGFDEA